MQRGNVGGARVHLPSVDNASYALGLILQSRAATVADVVAAMNELERTCAALCAVRGDRKRGLVPKLQRLNAEAQRVIDEPEEYYRVVRAFHRCLIDECGNETLIVLAGALETLWLAHWRRPLTSDAIPASRSVRRRGIEDHATMSELVREGDAERARAFWSRHGTEAVAEARLTGRLSDGSLVVTLERREDPNVAV